MSFSRNCRFITCSRAAEKAMLSHLYLVTCATLITALPVDKNLIDLSYGYNNNTLSWITHPPFELKIIQGDRVTDGHTTRYQTDEVKMSTHSGTHLDAPCHFFRGTWCVSDIPVEHLYRRPAVVVDVSAQCLVDRDYEVTVQDLVDAEKLHGRIPEGAVVLIRTGHGRYWPIKEQYMGTDTADASKAHFPGLHVDTARWLVAERHIVGVAIEGPSIDRGQSPINWSHEVLSEANIYIIENMSNMVRMVPSSGSLVTLLPMKLDSASGAPVRIIVQLNAGQPTSSATKLPSSNLLLAMSTCYFVLLCFFRHSLM
ncbi:Kynurenine formamidase [Halotydeus destructor]|nr:Kynurenine formamidase [Halotydeus destructor]